MKVVNPYMVGAVFTPFVALEGREAATAAAIDVSDEVGVRRCLRRVVVPYFKGFDGKSREAVRRALGDLVIVEGGGWGEMLDDKRVPFASDMVFKWLWLELFDNDPIPQGVSGDYVVKPDFEETNLIENSVSAFHLSPMGVSRS